MIVILVFAIAIAAWLAVSVGRLGHMRLMATTLFVVYLAIATIGAELVSAGFWFWFITTYLLVMSLTINTQRT